MLFIQSDTDSKSIDMYKSGQMTDNLELRVRREAACMKLWTAEAKKLLVIADGTTANPPNASIQRLAMLLTDWHTVFQARRTYQIDPYVW